MNKKQLIEKIEHAKEVVKENNDGKLNFYEWLGAFVASLLNETCSTNDMFEVIEHIPSNN